jgi:hypothetical protein
VRDYNEVDWTGLSDLQARRKRQNRLSKRAQRKYFLYISVFLRSFYGFQGRFIEVIQIFVLEKLQVFCITTSEKLDSARLKISRTAESPRKQTSIKTRASGYHLSDH